MNLLVLSDISQVEYLLKHQADMLMTHRPVTQDLAVAHELDRLQNRIRQSKREKFLIFLVRVALKNRNRRRR